MPTSNESDHGALRARLRALVVTARGSAWASLVARLVAIGSGLLLLAWIGRTTSAAPTPSGDADAGESAARAAVVDTPDADAPPELAPAPPRAPSHATAGARSRASPEDPVYINEADAAELRRLPGVGDKRAEAILALRRRVGRFRRIEDLLRVKGIGRKTITKWRPCVRLDLRAPDGGAS